MNWKDRALQEADAHKVWEQDVFWPTIDKTREEMKAKQVEAFGIALRTLLGEDITVEDLKVTVDGVAFGWERDRDTAPPYEMYEVVMYGTCPWCGASTKSDAVESLARVGNLLTAFEPWDGHICHT
jgi:hypothetical protein